LGIPLVQPKLGAFPEIIEASGGGVIYQPNTSEVLAQKLAEVLSNPEQIKLMSINGRKSVEEKFNTKILIKKMIEVYKSLVSKN
jgi:glycosyltransferase involved in cell wall biosynthesis